MIIRTYQLKKMNRTEIIKQLKEFFDIDELVCNHTLQKWGEQSWQFLRTEYLADLLMIRRDIIKKPMFCNDKNHHQKGLRCNRCDLVRTKQVVYLSSHILGCAGDFTSPNYTAEQMRQLIKNNAALLPYPCRIEGDVSWLHVDTLPQYNITDKVYEFKG